MKNKNIRKWTTLIIFSLVLFGCEEDGPDPASLILGRWEISSVTITYYIGTIQINQQIETFAPNELVVELVDGGTGYLYEEEIQTGTFVWSLDGNILTFPPPDMDPVDGKLKISKTSLKVTWEEEEVDGGITTIVKYRIDANRIL